jgi:hypothetical protein
LEGHNKEKGKRWKLYIITKGASMKKDKRSKFILAINEKFPPENPKYQVGLIVNHPGEETQYIISGESSAFYPDNKEMSLPVIDYYGEYRGGYPWIHPEIEKMAKEWKLRLEWNNPACVGVYDL